jgi:hypothetical protein
MKESEFDKRVVYTVRIELLNGKVLQYSIDTENKQYLINKLRINSDGVYEDDRLSFLWFETTYSRQVIVNTNSIARIIFCFDYSLIVVDQEGYCDNFNVLDQEYLPQAIIYLKGSAPEGHHQNIPLLYSSLEEGCLASFDFELDGDQRLRQFINLIDEDGEETFILLEQIIVMEFDQNLMYAEEEISDEEVEDEEGENEEL